MFEKRFIWLVIVDLVVNIDIFVFVILGIEILLIK